MTFVGQVVVVVESGRSETVRERVHSSAESRGIGVREEAPGVYGPLDEASWDRGDVLAFSIDDGPDGPGAMYLLDLLDYAPEADIGGLPLGGRDRLMLLAGLVEELVTLDAVISCQVALTDCGEIERIVPAEIKSFRSVLAKDFAEYAPPNVLYSFGSSGASAHREG